MNENIVKIICILIGLVAGFVFVPMMVGVFMYVVKIIVGLFIAILIFNLYKKYIER